MGIINRVEHGLAKAVHGAFAKAFKSEVQPVELASGDPPGHGRPRRRHGPRPHDGPEPLHDRARRTDFERLSGYEEALSDELVAAAQEHADSQRYQPGGPVQISFHRERGARDRRVPVVRAPRRAAGRDRPRAPQAPRPRRPRPSRHRTRPSTSRPGPAARPRSDPVARPWLDIAGDRYPLLGSLTTVSVATSPPTSSSTTPASRGVTARSA